MFWTSRKGKHLPPAHPFSESYWRTPSANTKEKTKKDDDMEQRTHGRGVRVPQNDGRRHQDDEGAPTGEEGQDEGHGHVKSTHCESLHPQVPPSLTKLATGRPPAERKASSQKAGFRNGLNPGERRRKCLEGYKQSPRLCGGQAREATTPERRAKVCRRNLSKNKLTGGICNVINLVENCSE